MSEGLVQHSTAIINAAIESVKPEKLIPRKVRVENDRLVLDRRTFELKRFKNIWVVGAGKASAYMAFEIEKILGERITGGLVVTKYGHGKECRRIRIEEAGHPVLDRNGIAASHSLLRLVEKAGEDDLVLCLISGGGSALLEKLPDDISLDDLKRVFEIMLACGATIEEVNTVRKHLSQVKGGRLARAVAPATCVSLIISDVIGDPLEAIASGPTVPDPTTFADAWRVVEKYRLEKQLPPKVRDYLYRGLQGKEPDTLKEGDPIFRKVYNLILGNNFEALTAAAKKAAGLGYHTLILTSRLQGEAREVARVMAALVQEELTRALPLKRPACLLMGGETTVTLHGRGKGGRNQELALAALVAMKGLKADYLICSIGTDGTDGPTDAAGGRVFPELWNEVEKRHLDPLAYLENNDAYHFLEQTGGLIKTGPTGTNVMDLVFALVP